MKSRTTLVLMEQLVMVLVFALASALCLQAFVKADSISRQTARRDEAVVLAQNAAELLKAGEDPEALLETGEFDLEITALAGDIPGLAQARITVSWEKEPLFSLTTGWQEAAP